jgi:hypothetical protein
MGGHAACMGYMRNAYKVLIQKFKEKRHFGRPRQKWEDNIKNYLVKCREVDRIHMAQC